MLRFFCPVIKNITTSTGVILATSAVGAVICKTIEVATKNVQNKYTSLPVPLVKTPYSPKVAQPSPDFLNGPS